MIDESTTRGSRVLVAVNGDIVDYSRLMADDPVSTAEIVDSLHHLVDRAVADRSGTLVNFVGDNFMAVFGDAKDAMAAAISITTSVEERNASTPGQRWTRFRLGLDEGDVSEVGGDHFGDALNIAARVQALAPPGGIAVSGRVYRALDEPALRFRSAGRKSLKGVPEAVDIFEYVGLPTEDGRRDTPRSNRLSLEVPSMVILPIHSETTTDEVRSMAELLRSDLTHRLATLPNLNVMEAAAGRSGSRGPARYMLETGVHQFGTNLRLYAKVIEMATMNVTTTHKWATTVDDMFNLIDQITEEVSHAVEIELVIGEQAKLVHAGIRDPEMIEQVYTGWFHVSSGTPEGWHKAKEAFEKVALRYPDEPYGHSLSAFTHWIGAMEGFSNDPNASLDRATEHASKLLAMDDPTGMGHMVLGAIHLTRGRPDDALEAIEGAKITRPTCDVTYALEGSVRRYLGQWERSVDLMDTAMRLSAVTPPWYPVVQACAMFMAGRLDSARAIAEEVLEYHPNNLEALMVLVATQLEMGLERRAHATADLIKERLPAVDVAKWIEGRPYKDREPIRRWRVDLARVGLVPAEAP